MAKKLIRVSAQAWLTKVIEIDFDALPHGYEGDEPEEVRQAAHIMDAVGGLFGADVEVDLKEYDWEEVDLEADRLLEEHAAKERARLALNHDGTG